MIVVCFKINLNFSMSSTRRRFICYSLFCCVCVFLCLCVFMVFFYFLWFICSVLKIYLCLVFLKCSCVCDVT